MFLGIRDIMLNITKGQWEPCGQSYKHFTLVNYDSRVVHDFKMLHITTLES